MEKGATKGVREAGFWKRQVVKIGVAGSLFGSFFAGLCCLGLPALVAIFSAFGLGFLINNAIVQPLLQALLKPHPNAQNTGDVRCGKRLTEAHQMSARC